ncbi:MAG: hypothetical protein KDC54_06915, partial [Lewinella sp.]|nr:hypothetical protein [Lewinella sp.]
MDKVQFIAAVREHITKGETDKALALALQWLSTSPEADNSWLDNVRSLNAQFERTRREQQRRIISYEQAQLNLNQTNHYLLEAMEGLEDGRRAPAETPDATQQTPTRRLTWLYALLGVAAVTIAAIFVVPGLLNSGSGTDDTVDDQPDEQPVSTCPSFDEQSDFNIMLLPFKPPSDGNNLDIHTTLQLRLAEYSDRYDLPASVLIGNVDLKDVNNYPTNGRDAERIGRPCHANLIIWGHIFKEMDGSNLVRTSYHLLDKDYFTLTDYELNEEAELDTLTSLSSIITDGTLSRGIEHALLAIFGMVAHETEHYAAAVEVFEDLQQSTPPEE